MQNDHRCPPIPFCLNHHQRGKKRQTQTTTKTSTTTNLKCLPKRILQKIPRQISHQNFCLGLGASSPSPSSSSSTPLRTRHPLSSFFFVVDQFFWGMKMDVFFFLRQEGVRKKCSFHTFSLYFLSHRFRFIFCRAGVKPINLLFHFLFHHVISHSPPYRRRSPEFVVDSFSNKQTTQQRGE